MYSSPVLSSVLLLTCTPRSAGTFCTMSVLFIYILLLISMLQLISWSERNRTSRDFVIFYQNQKPYVIASSKSRVSIVCASHWTHRKVSLFWSCYIFLFAHNSQNILRFSRTGAMMKTSFSSPPWRIQHVYFMLSSLENSDRYKTRMMVRKIKNVTSGTVYHVEIILLGL